MLFDPPSIEPLPSSSSLPPPPPSKKQVRIKREQSPLVDRAPKRPKIRTTSIAMVPPPPVPLPPPPPTRSRPISRPIPPPSPPVIASSSSLSLPVLEEPLPQATASDEKVVSEHLDKMNRIFREILDQSKKKVEDTAKDLLWSQVNGFCFFIYRRIRDLPKQQVHVPFADVMDIMTDYLRKGV